LPLQPFSLIGATTRAGLLSGPMRSRFGLTHNLEFYSEEDLLKILMRSAGLMGLAAAGHHDPHAAAERSEAAGTSTLTLPLRAIARRSRGTPRVANRLLRRVRDFAQVRSDGRLSPRVVDEALRLEGVDELGLDELDRRYLKTLGTTYDGGPAGLEAVAATMGEDAGTLEEMVEPFLLQIGFLARTRRGRQLTRQGASHVGLELRNQTRDDDALFE
ncbi:MAG: Holliday junction DNA helicase RuvB C-terminal domain-containing protein, partial [Phycisphaeraceae bacterium]